MEEVSCFLNSHYEIQQIVILVGDYYEYSQLKRFLNDTNIRHFKLVGNLLSENIKSISESFQRDTLKDDIKKELEYVNVTDFNGLSGTWALVVENCENEMILKGTIWKPQYLLATIWQNNITAFKIWECYREFTQYIQIKTLRYGKETQMLEWEKNKNSDIELSVIFPMYNVAKYLDQCISSVIEWKAPYVEFLFVNDGSPDNSREVVLEWAQKDSRIKLLDKINGGCASARQYGLDCAKGRYIGFIDPDDFIDGSMFRKLLRAAMTGSYDISYCGYNEYYEDTKKMKQVEDELGTPYCDGTSDTRMIQNLIAYSRVAIWRGIYKKDLLDKNNIHFYTDLRRFDDLPYKIETFAFAKSVIAVPEHLYYYRLARPGQDVSADDERLYVHFDIFKYLNKSIAETYDARLIDLLQICKIQTHLYAIKKIKNEFRKEYIRRAKIDLETTGDGKRTYNIIKECIGEKNAENYLAILNEKPIS